jgi:large subunit ribosomal protein L14
MIKKYTLLNIADNSGIKVVKCFHHYFGSQKLTSRTGDFIKVSVRKRRYHKKWLKSKMVYTLKKGKKLKTYIVRTKYKTTKQDGSYFRFSENASLTLKKRMTSRGKYAFGPFSYGHNRKKVLGSFAGII